MKTGYQYEGSVVLVFSPTYRGKSTNQPCYVVELYGHQPYQLIRTQQFGSRVMWVGEIENTNPVTRGKHQIVSC